MPSTLELYESELAKVIKQHEAKAEKVVPELYKLLRQMQEPKEARTTLEHDLSRIWKVDTIQKYLPDECKDQKAQELGRKRQQSRKLTHAETIPAENNPNAEEILVSNNGSQQPDSTPIVNSLPAAINNIAAEARAELKEEKRTTIGAVPDRHANHAERQAVRIQELEQILQENNDYIKDLKERLAVKDNRIRELEETREVKIGIEVNDRILPTIITVRQLPKFSVFGIVDPVRMKALEH